MKLATIFLLFCYTSYSQIKKEFEMIENVNSIYNLVYWTAIDTALWVDSKYYSNGQRKFIYYGNEINKIDSMFAFFENGNVALEVRISHYTKVINEYSQEIETPCYIRKTYYESGNIRSYEKSFALLNEQFYSLDLFLDSVMKVFYKYEYSFTECTSDQETIHNFNGNTIQIIRKKCGEVIEVWTIDNFLRNPLEGIVIRSVEHCSSKKIITKQSKLRRYAKNVAFYYLDNQLILKEK